MTTLSSIILPFFANLFKYLDIDIILERKSNNDDILIKDMHITNRVFYGIEICNKYDVIISDRTREITSFKNKKLIFISHSIDNVYKNFLENIDLIIYTSKNHTKFNSIQIEYDDYKFIKNIPNSSKCELAYTGVFHINDFLNKNHQKNILRSEILNKFKINIPNDKPFIFVLEDELSEIEDIIIGINAISKFATVVFKPLYSLSSSLSKLISNNIIILNNAAFNPAIFRFSADYILAGFCSGSFISSIIAGQYILPYYSEYLKTKKPGVHSIKYRYDRMIKNNINTNSIIQDVAPRDILISYFNRQNYLFNIKDHNKIKYEIFSNDYITWYKNHISIIRKEAFGDYLVENAAEKTAEYIMRFARDGTVGKYCSGIYLKKNSFN